MKKRIITILTEGCRRLRESEKRFEDIYNIVFSYSGVFSRTYKDKKVSELTYTEAKNRIEALSGAIYGRVGSGNFIGLYGANSEKWLLLFWAILRSGNKPYLINLRQPEAQIISCLSTLKIGRVIFTEEEKELGCDGLSYDELTDKSEPLPESVPFENELAITTSGTSLQEKICIFSGREISAQILNSLEAVGRNRRIIKGCKGEIRMLMLLPLYHIFGLVASYLCFLFTGAVFC
ncbi:MAG: acyl--CoA ligase, partial [Clostridia bacterium]|nr:acyl--CoA ligase [Clostridia bacterium]